MKCQLKISLYCKKVFRKKAMKIIDGKDCCENCYWLQKKKNKEKRQELPSKAKNIIARNKNKYKGL